MEALTSQRLLDTIAMLLSLAPLVNTYFAWLGWRMYRADPLRSPILLAFLATLLVVWLIGLVTAVLSVVYLLQPPAQPSTVSGILFGLGLLLVQGLPHFIASQMRRIERGHG